MLFRSSVSCIYSMGDPSEYEGQMVSLRPGMRLTREELMRRLVDIQYERNDTALERGCFRVRGDTVEVIPADQRDFGVRVEFFGDEIDRLSEFALTTGQMKRTTLHAPIYPATFYATDPVKRDAALETIERDMEAAAEAFEKDHKPLEAERIRQRTR